MIEHVFTYNWYLKDGYPASGIEKNNLKVFSCFACGGGSTMGYKLAGYDVLGCNEIDKRMIDVYIENHYPKYAYNEPIQIFKNRIDLPEELYNLDILDGSPPCSSFSIAGNRDKDWGKEKYFREGQEKQVLDTLFFDFIDLAKKLQPKVIIAENVKGLLIGEAKKYVQKIHHSLNNAGYYSAHWLLDASVMGVPQKRERVFFISIRKDIADKLNENIFTLSEFPYINIDFNENEIIFNTVENLINDKKLINIKEELTELYKNYWNESKSGEPVGKFNTYKKIYKDKVITTLPSSNNLYHYSECRELSDLELKLCSSFPLDYNFIDQSVNYICGMSVPPIMTAQIALRIKKYWFDKIK